MKLTVYHNGQFWVGVVEESFDDSLRAKRTIFGSEPCITEIWNWVNGRDFASMLENVTACVPVEEVREKKISPKRLARLVGKEIRTEGASTFAQNAIKQDLEARKKLRASVTKQHKEELKQRKRDIARAKAKAKHRGH